MAAEPRLTALLDDPLNLFRSISQHPSLQLPPLQDPIPSLSASRPLPLEPSASANRDAHASPAPQYSISAGRAAGGKTRAANGGLNGGENVAQLVEGVGKAVEKSSTLPNANRSQARQKNTNEMAESTQASSSRKRQKVDADGEADNSYLQLPKMCKKRAHSGRAPSLAGLEHIVSPLNVAGSPGVGTAYPPIAPGAFEDAHGRNALNADPAITREAAASGPVGDASNGSAEKPSKRENRRPRRKWGEQETDHLLKGVSLYGVGSWKKILEHPGFSFNARSSIDLKDRFRTCFPQEYRKHLDSKPNGSNNTVERPQGSTSAPRPLPSVIPENILNVQDSPTSSASAASPQNISPSPSRRPRKSRTDRKSTGDLVRLGIEGPFPKAQRRERRAFTDEEDADLLRGYQIYGPLWSSIQSDPRLNLGSRRSMDVRDRFRNRYPEKYAEAGYKTRSKSFPKSPLRTSGKGDEEADRPMSPLSSNPADSGKTKEGRPRGTGNAAGGLNATDETQVSTGNLSDFGDSSLPAFSSQGTGESEIQRLLLDHIHPLATWNSSRPPILSNANTIHIPNTEPQDRTDPDLTDPPSQTASQLATQHLLPNPPKSSRPQPQPQPQPHFLSTLPPLLDPLDSTLTSSALTFLNYKVADTIPKRAGPPDSRNLNGVSDIIAGLNWEDMATHPMFDIDTGVGGGEDGGIVKGK
ncbi:hypothetical protein FGG08_001964 [Glutinoglossum americanum]|uniref:Uncharacterized protein n=1 Tax=Glutinoglossum americanum TaxID=1670608 RepID=A0A9P8KZP8_9PEZI|nr:hypothetical protein FGG08_001964 [Glutinoglossum americanum]